MSKPPEAAPLEPDQLASWQDDGGARLCGSCIPHTEGPRRKRKWVAPVVTKHNLKDSTLGQGGSCIDGTGNGNFLQRGQGNDPECRG